MKFKIKTFNPVFFVLFATTFLLSALFHFYYLRVGVDQAKTVLYVIHALNIGFYIFYKSSILKDREYAEILQKNGIHPSEFWSEVIPLQLCNVSYFITPLALYTNNRFLYAFIALVLPFAVILPLLMPLTGLSNDSILKPRIAGYYITHLYMLFSHICIMGMNLYSPEYIDAFGVLLVCFVISFLAHTANISLRKLNICQTSNYFFTMSPDGNPVLEFLYRTIRIQWLYILVIFVPFYFAFLGIIFIAKIFGA